MIRTSAVGIASMNDLTDASGATFANDGPLESVGILASNVQRSPAASIFALRYDGPTFRLSLRASSSAYRSSDQPFRGGVRKQRSNFALVMGCRRIGVHVTAAGRAGPNIFHCGQPCSERNQY